MFIIRINLKYFLGQQTVEYMVRFWSLDAVFLRKQFGQFESFKKACEKGEHSSFYSIIGEIKSTIKF